MLGVVVAHRAPPRRVPDPGSPKGDSPTSALDALLRSGVIGEREHAAGLAYGRLRARFEAAARSARSGGAGILPEAQWFALKRRHAALLDAAGFERFLLDRVVLDGEAPLSCEVGRVGAALGRVAALPTPSASFPC